MFDWLKKYIWGGVIAGFAFLGLALAIQTKRNKTLTAEANGAKKATEKATEQLQRNTEIICEAKAKRKDVLTVENKINNIQKDTAEAVKSAQEIRKTDTVTFGKWAIIFAVLFIGSGCASTLSECRAVYPCPDNVCISITSPVLNKLPRPDLAELAVKYDESKQGFVLSPEQIGSLLGNERALIETIKGYEKIIDVYNEWRLKQ